MLLGNIKYIDGVNNRAGKPDARVVAIAFEWINVNNTNEASLAESTSFASLNLSENLMSELAAKEFTSATPIQAGAIPVILEGSDLIGLARTGSGKTAAFVLPILERLQKTQSDKPRALILAPTRELAQQINDVIVSFSGSTGLKSMSIYGGAPIERQIGRLKRGVDIVVGCPGRILDHAARHTINLTGIEILVMDEADQMFDMGFLPTIRKILAKLPKDRQSLMFSATMPTDVRRLAEDCLKNPKSIKFDFGAPTSQVSHAIYPVAPQLKTQLLMAILKKTDTQSVLVFVKTKHRAKKISQVLEGRGLSVTSLQGNLSHSRRAEAMSGFRSGEYQIMVATDIAARGLDISSVSHVINYDMPATVDAYTHRIGRTGRAAKTGDAYTLVTGEDRQMINQIEATLKSKLERRELEDFDYKAMPKEESGKRFSRDSRDGGFRGGRRGEYRPRDRGFERSSNDSRNGPSEGRRGESSSRDSGFERSSNGSRDEAYKGRRKEYQAKEEGFKRSSNDSRDGASRGRRSEYRGNDRGFTRNSNDSRDGSFRGGPRGERRSSDRGFSRGPRDSRDGASRGSRGEYRSEKRGFARSSNESRDGAFKTGRSEYQPKDTGFKRSSTDSRDGSFNGRRKEYQPREQGFKRQSNDSRDGGFKGRSQDSRGEQRPKRAFGDRNRSEGSTGFRGNGRKPSRGGRLAFSR